MNSLRIIYQSLCIWLTCAGFFLACRAQSTVDGTHKVRAIEMASLLNAGGWIYFGDYISLPIRGGPGSKFLAIAFDSAAYEERTHRLYVSGRILRADSTEGLQGVQIMVGMFLREQGQLIENDRDRPIPAYHHRIMPVLEDTTDVEGRFSIYSQIDASSSLIIANMSYHLYVYDVGKLVDSTWAK